MRLSFSSRALCWPALVVGPVRRGLFRARSPIKASQSPAASSILWHPEIDHLAIASVRTARTLVSCRRENTRSVSTRPELFPTTGKARMIGHRQRRRDKHQSSTAVLRLRGLPRRWMLIRVHKQLTSICFKPRTVVAKICSRRLLLIHLWPVIESHDVEYCGIFINSPSRKALWCATMPDTVMFKAIVTSINGCRSISSDMTYSFMR